MIDLPATRRENLQKIRDKRFTSNAELARAIERASSQVNDMLTGTKSFGPKVARAIEEKLKLPRGYLDEPRDRTGTDALRQENTHSLFRPGRQLDQHRG